MAELHKAGIKNLVHKPSSTPGNWTISSLGDKRLSPPGRNREAVIFTRLVGNGGPSLIMLNLSKPSGHSSHPVGNKHPQVKFYEVLKGTLWVLREPSYKLKPAMEKQYNVNCGRQYLKILSLLPNQRNCSGERERYARLYVSPMISGEVECCTSNIFSSLRAKAIKGLLFPTQHLVQCRCACAYINAWNMSKRWAIFVSTLTGSPQCSGGFCTTGRKLELWVLRCFPKVTWLIIVES